MSKLEEQAGPEEDFSTTLIRLSKTGNLESFGRGLHMTSEEFNHTVTGMLRKVQKDLAAQEKFLAEQRAQKYQQQQAEMRSFKLSRSLDFDTLSRSDSASSFLLGGGGGGGYHRISGAKRRIYEKMERMANDPGRLEQLLDTQAHELREKQDRVKQLLKKYQSVVLPELSPTKKQSNRAIVAAAREEHEREVKEKAEHIFEERKQHLIAKRNEKEEVYKQRTMQMSEERKGKLLHLVATGMLANFWARSLGRFLKHARTQREQWRKEEEERQAAALLEKQLLPRMLMQKKKREQEQFDIFRRAAFSWIINTRVRKKRQSVTAIRFFLQSLRQSFSLVKNAKLFCYRVKRSQYHMRRFLKILDAKKQLQLLQWEKLERRMIVTEMQSIKSKLAPLLQLSSAAAASPTAAEKEHSKNSAASESHKPKTGANQKKGTAASTSGKSAQKGLKAKPKVAERKETAEEIALKMNLKMMEDSLHLGHLAPLHVRDQFLLEYRRRKRKEIFLEHMAIRQAQINRHRELKKFDPSLNLYSSFSFYNKRPKKTMPLMVPQRELEAMIRQSWDIAHALAAETGASSGAEKAPASAQGGPQPSGQ